MRISKALTLATAAALCSVATPAMAGVTISGTTSGTGYQGSNGLIINVGGLAFGPITLNNVGDSQTVAVLTVGTPEGSVNLGEDTTPRAVTANFAFNNPLGTTGSPLIGFSSGFIQLFTSCGLIAGGCGQVDWGGPQVFNFGGGGAFSVALQDVTFATPGSATVNAKFKLISNAVPEPATWALMILGFGAIGAAMRAPRRQTTTARIRFA